MMKRFYVKLESCVAVASEKEMVKDLVIYYRLQMSGTPPEM